VIDLAKVAALDAIGLFDEVRNTARWIIGPHQELGE
jgi:hypothetical protein